MKKIALYTLLLGVMVSFTACHDRETYADQKKKERQAIRQFISEQNITTISEEEFEAAGYKTDVEKNEYVGFTSSGVYMQIVREGCGEKLKNGETATLLCRFTEENLMEDSLFLSNNIHRYAQTPDRITVRNVSGSFSASFISGLMMDTYGSTCPVPKGWLVPLTYIKIGRPTSADEEIAKVRLIVPHTEGQSNASYNVYPCFYEITYERGL